MGAGIPPPVMMNSGRLKDALPRVGNPVGIQLSRKVMAALALAPRLLTDRMVRMAGLRILTYSERPPSSPVSTLTWSNINRLFECPFRLLGQVLEALRISQFQLTFMG